ncbi:MAG: exosome complex protein Rrp4 [Nanoarchaeota archaeon]|nr:exosome complex protein Rrp4 [Nanoarchaeota archaeon]MBU4241836.1 exosome complex protein Rrp4 [Nanoarchaeota archaeon]MBU4352411.1 exosome complex protein Rrp4 [Nanoarchaeota archaeon]MBU4456062.1 exosome complex protein Rrp4 [Nanoarchaeota archaeon]MCG2720295.1 exosome complex RNA-binding protein Rrp4 [Nanoarchaeota archaeon]
MGNILIKEKQIVVPGEILAEGMDFLPANGAFRENDKVISMRLGLVSVNGRLIKVIPLAGKYVPMRDDLVIGKVQDMNYSSWFIDVGYAQDAVLNMRDATSDFIERGAELSQYYDIGDFVAAKITNVTRSKMMDITMKGPGLKKLVGGRIIEVTPVKVPRIVGKQGSMISMIKKYTNCQIIVGQNGRVWVSGKDPSDEHLAVEAILMIERLSHISGLTDKVKSFLEKHKGKMEDVQENTNFQGERK